ncbi:type II toxin-antitoxin system Phd/YefM family antitoxin [Halomonas urumqiensis]|uniref:Type II toxin-antitoxin system Phd/YefM family antitoxin n=1 Tax=Halomonas urumqiensis TaxID=1684789 RepID=A0A2N7UCV7_9GAMM|nr:type II toxin-antitoxin system Phd/YefM family antitoxin [Halomonas urumqiensis]PMR78260.1 type II toxin-antitoxin system Phd/YefM family antitoxin [Halomonas urumqiensis]PTB03408.1 type II toxin-antitoxin system Phd/YefM family antitoxin [Halomonas urumqiensis]GHE20420.1 prevent-host-death protein [Halomonas urumqiensis]
MRTETISYLKQHAATLDVEEPLVITQKGKPTYVVESYASHERREQAIALLKLLSLGEKSRAEGKSSTVDAFMEKVKTRHAARRGDSM